MTDILEKINPKHFADRLWGDFYFGLQSKKITKRGDIGQSRTFVHFILEPLYKLFAHVSLFECLRLSFLAEIAKLC